MTSENDLNPIENLDTIETKEELKKEEEILPKIENEPIDIQTPKRPGRKKREVSSVGNDDAMDTQPLFEQPIIIEGKRSRKPTSRLELSDLETPKKELAIPQVHPKTSVCIYPSICFRVMENH